MILGELPAIKKLLNKQSLRSTQADISISKEFFVVQAFHITPTKNRDSILRYGLIPSAEPNGGLSYPPALFFSLTVEDLPWGYINPGQADIWTFCISHEKLIADKYGPSGKWFYTKETIPYYKLYLQEYIPDVHTWGMQTSP